MEKIEYKKQTSSQWKIPNYSTIELSKQELYQIIGGSSKTDDFSLILYSVCALSLFSLFAGYYFIKRGNNLSANAGRPAGLVTQAIEAVAIPPRETCPQAYLYSKDRKPITWNINKILNFPTKARPTLSLNKQDLAQGSYDYISLEGQSKCFFPLPSYKIASVVQSWFHPNASYAQLKYNMKHHLKVFHKEKPADSCAWKNFWTENWRCLIESVMSFTSEVDKELSASNKRNVGFNEVMKEDICALFTMRYIRGGRRFLNKKFLMEDIVSVSIDILQQLRKKQKFTLSSKGLEKIRLGWHVVHNVYYEGVRLPKDVYKIFSKKGNPLCVGHNFLSKSSRAPLPAYRNK